MQRNAKTLIVEFLFVVGFVFSYLSVCIDQGYRTLNLEDHWFAVLAGAPYLLLLGTRRMTPPQSRQQFFPGFLILALAFLIATTGTHLLGHNGTNRGWGFAWIPAFFVILAEYAIALGIILIVLILRLKNWHMRRAGTLTGHE